MMGIMELKACKAIAQEHVAQVLGYLRSANMEHGVLINFGGRRFQIKKYALTPQRAGGVVAKALALLAGCLGSFLSLRG